MFEFTTTERTHVYMLHTSMQRWKYDWNMNAITKLRAISFKHCFWCASCFNILCNSYLFIFNFLYEMTCAFGAILATTVCKSFYVFHMKNIISISTVSLWHRVCTCLLTRLDNSNIYFNFKNIIQLKKTQIKCSKSAFTWKIYEKMEN